MGEFIFSFGDNYNQVESKYLKGGEIHSVKLESVEFHTIQGTKDPTESFKVIDFVFKSPETERTFNHRMFSPKDQTYFERGTSQKGFATPSQFEVNTFEIGHILTKLVPENLEKLQKATGLDTFEKYAELVVKALKPAINKKETKLKLILDNKGRARLPFAVSLGKDGKPYLSSSFLGDELTFSPYEMEQIKKVREGLVATPTPTPSEDGISYEDAGSVSSPEIDLDAIDLDI